MVSGIAEQVKQQIIIHRESKNKGLVVCDTQQDIEEVKAELLNAEINQEDIDSIQFITKKQLKKIEANSYSFATIYHKEFLNVYFKVKSRVRV